MRYLAIVQKRREKRANLIRLSMRLNVNQNKQRKNKIYRSHSSLNWNRQTSGRQDRISGNKYSA